MRAARAHPVRPGVPARPHPLSPPRLFNTRQAALATSISSLLQASLVKKFTFPRKFWALFFDAATPMESYNAFWAARGQGGDLGVAFLK